MINSIRAARIGVAGFGIGLMTFGGGVAVAQVVPVVREGAGERRTALDKMELEAFPSDAWGKLSDWVGGRTLTAADTKGSVVLICTYSDWYDPAKRAWSLARRLAESKGKDGLVVVGVHHPEEWSTAKKDVPKDGKVYLAHDAKGEFRKLLRSDQDPDFYVIDRAGQLRFADIETESVDNAVTQLLAETSESAAGVKSRMAAAAAADDAAFRKSGANRDRVDLKTLPEVPFTDPDKAAYESATWPKKPENKDNNSNQDNTPKTIQMPAAGPFFPKAPQLKGRAIVIYVWNPEVRSTYDKVMPMMDRLQTQHGRDVAIVGAAAFTAKDQYSAPQIDTKDAVKKVQAFLNSRSFEHTLTLYQDGMIGARDNNNENLNAAVVASSNGVIRWSGSPTSPGFIAALEQVIAADPAVKARRAAEEAYIKAQGK